MSDNVTIGKRLIPIEEIALIEPFEPSEQSRLRTTRSFSSRLIMRNRESVLSEFSISDFVDKRGFRLLIEDQVATNPVFRFSVEAFEPTESFTPAKPYRTRLLWRDSDGNTQSRLLVSDLGQVLEVVVRRTSNAKEPNPHKPQSPATTGRSRPRRSQREPA